MHADSRLLSRVECATPAEVRADRIVDVVMSQIDRACRDAEVAFSGIAGAGFGFPVAFDAAGEVLTSPNIPAFVGTRSGEVFGDAMSSMFGRRLPVAIANDCCCAVLAEARLGAGVGLDPLLYLTVSTGVGGARFEAGKAVNLEPGLSLYPDPRQRDRSLESLAGGAGLAKSARRLARIRLDRESPLAELLIRRADSASHCLETEIDGLDARDLGIASAAGDELARSLLEGSADMVALAIDLLLDQENGEKLVVMGGSLALGVPWYIERVVGRSRYCREFSASAPLLVPTSLAGDQGILGAALLARDEFLSRRDRE